LHRYDPRMRNRALFWTGIGVMAFYLVVALIVNDYLGWDRGGWSWSRLVIGVGLGTVLVAIGWFPERLAPRAVFGVLGLLACLYGLSSLTGGWFGTAPWHYERVDWIRWLVKHPHDPVPPHPGETIVVANPDRWAILSYELVAYGLALVVSSLWPRYRGDEAYLVND
jgi:MFS family permease